LPPDVRFYSAPPAPVAGFEGGLLLREGRGRKEGRGGKRGGERRPFW